jgi:flagellar assembly protein FliH
MMSLSNNETDQFKPLAVHSLDRFDDEFSTANEDTEPDYNRFKLLIEKPRFDQNDVPVFEALYQEPEEQEEIIFKPLIEKKETPLQTRAGKKNIAGQETFAQETPSELKEDVDPIEIAEQKGYQEGLEKGLEQGKERGHKEGLDAGFKDGQAKGLEQGTEKGFAAGQEKGLEQGLIDGEARAMEETRQKALVILSTLEDALTRADQTLERLVDVYEEQIILLIKQIAEKAVMAQIQIDEQIVRPMVIDALKHLVQPEEVVLSVSVEDYEYIEMVKDEFFEQVESLKSVSVRSDPAIKRGGCRIDTHTASVSTDPESRLQAIFEAMKKAGAV